MGSNDKISGDRDADIYGQRIRPLDRLLHEKRMPVLFVGSGISGRYMDTCTWDALLEKAAAVMGIDRFRLNGIKAGLETEHPGANVYPLLASELSKRMNGMIGRGELTRDSFPGMTDGEWGLMETCNPFKAVVCSIVKGGKLTDDPEKLAELESFRKVAGKVPAVITTNYDRFLETEVFDGFDTLVYPDDFYFSGSEGYGEILKIHGTTDAPDSIVLTSEDYARLRRESKVVLSRLTYLMCYHPVIFIGYSLRDEEVHDMIFDLVSSLKQTDIDKIRGHLIRVHVSDKLRKSKWNPKILESDGKRIEVMDLEVPSPEVLFRYLDRFTPVASAAEIKRYYEMIRRIVLSTDPSSDKISVIGEDGIGRMVSRDYAVVFGDADSMSSMDKGLTGYEISDALKDVLTDRKGLLDTSETAFTKWASQARICNGNRFVPLFHYYLVHGMDHRTIGGNLAEFTDRMIGQIESKIDALATRCRLVSAVDEIDSFLMTQATSFSRCDALMYFHHMGIISKDECRARLLRLYKDGSCLDKKGNMKSDMRCAIVHLDMQEYMKGLRGAPVLSPTIVQGCGPHAENTPVWYPTRVQD